MAKGTFNFHLNHPKLMSELDIKSLKKRLYCEKKKLVCFQRTLQYRAFQDSKTNEKWVSCFPTFTPSHTFSRYCSNFLKSCLLFGADTSPMIRHASYPLCFCRRLNIRQVSFGMTIRPK